MGPNTWEENYEDAHLEESSSHGMSRPVHGPGSPWYYLSPFP